MFWSCALAASALAEPRYFQHLRCCEGREQTQDHQDDEKLDEREASFRPSIPPTEKNNHREMYSR